jgi:hypothetical protein
MSTSLLRFRKKGFWVHNAVAEVWLCFLVHAVRSDADAPAWLQEMAKEIELALAAGWIDGVTSGAFDAHLDSTEKVGLFLTLLSSTNERILTETSPSQTVSIDKFGASSVFLAAEIQMVDTLFFRPDEMSESWKVFTLHDDWRVA